MKIKNKLESTTKAQIKKNCILKAPIEKSGKGWSSDLVDLQFHITESTFSRLKSSVKKVVEEMVGEKNFTVRVEGKAREATNFLIIPSDPKALRRVIQAKRNKFQSHAKEIKTGRMDSLSISLDFDMNPMKPYPVLLFIPDKEKDAHDHIVLSWKEAKSLRDWLDRNLLRSGRQAWPSGAIRGKKQK